jgi:hypothetical protein
MQAFFCKLVPPRPTFPTDLSPAEADVMMRHARYWQGMIDRKAAQVFALGLVLDPAGAFGIIVIEVADESAARALTASDPAITSGIGMRYEIHPMPRGVMHSPV